MEKEKKGVKISKIKPKEPLKYPKTKPGAVKSPGRDETTCRVGW